MKKAEFVADTADIANVHEEVNVWIVYPQLVVIVPPVAVAVPVRYLTTTTQLPPAQPT